MNEYNDAKDPASFRDPAGTVFYKNGEILRQINKSYQKQYDMLISTGLYESLSRDGSMVSHKIIDMPLPDEAYLIIKPKQIPYISYPYEWCFGQLKDAALTTLKIHRKALGTGMILKDASAYNIQFLHGTPILIDTLSFDVYQDGSPWVAYGQFCRHFLAPLYLMAYTDIRLSQLLKCYIDGIPLDLAKNLLGMRGGAGALQHIKWHANASKKNASAAGKSLQQVKISKFSHIAMIESLIRIIEKLNIKSVATEWGDYYQHTNYSNKATEDKKATVSQYLDHIKPATVWDFGANDGTYSRLSLKHNAHVVAFDIDPKAVEYNYLNVKNSKENMLPLILELTNPSPSIGFANMERRTIDSRQHPDCILALALIHHLAISNNLPLKKIASWISKLSNYLIIEFVPKIDTQVQKLLATRDDIFDQYTIQDFEATFSKFYDIIDKHEINETCRTLYLMKHHP